MQQWQQSLGHRLPAWLGSARPPLAKSILRAAGIGRLHSFITENQELPPFDFVEESLRFLNCRYQVDHVERERVPRSGPLIVVANHPLGALDALALIHFIGQVRRDVKVLANEWLQQIRPLGPLLLPVPVMRQASAAMAWRGAKMALDQSQAVLVFPAGEVSRFGISGVRDRPWSSGFLRLAAHAQAPILPVHIGGCNSVSFYGLSLLAKPLGTALLPRQLQRARQARLPLRVGHLEAPPAGVDRQNLRQESARIRRMVYALPESRPSIGPPAVCAAPNLRQLLRDVDTTQLLGSTPDGKEIRLAQPRLDSAMMAEIGRMREIAFRAVGEGSGKPSDVDRYDRHYEQLILWDRSELELVGAYRLGRCAKLTTEVNLETLYSASLFDLDSTRRRLLPQAMELGRSFVQPKYWNSRSLEYLWYGIGAYLRQQPQIRYLFGPVSISAMLPLQARDLLIAYYRRFYGAKDTHTRALQPARASSITPPFADDVDIALSDLKDRLNSLGCSIPTLYKQYTDLCEPGGVEFLAFNVDANFSACTDGLIWLDLAYIKPRKRRRYIEAPPDRAISMSRAHRTATLEARRAQH